MITKLKLALVRDGRSQYIIAREAAVSETRLSRLATNRAELTEDEAKRIAEALHVALDVIVDSLAKVELPFGEAKPANDNGRQL